MSNKHSKEEIEKIYKDLSYNYSDEEIADSFVFPSTLSKEEKEVTDAEFLKIRMEKLKQYSEEDIVYGELYRMKYRIEDYLISNGYNDYFTFPNQLREYLRISKRNQSKFAYEIQFDKTQISKIINGKISPSKEFIYRLEKHCENIISAGTWYKLYLKDVERDIVFDAESKKIQYKFVRSSLSVGLTN